MKTIKKEIECSSCKGTGIYVGMGEKDGAAVICHDCKGTGKYLYIFSYNDFAGRKKKADIKRVYLSSLGYCITPEDNSYDGIGMIEMSKEGISYEEFLEGKMPKHIKKMACPMSADQGACHDIKGFDDECKKLNDNHYISHILSCKCKDKMACWDRFEKESK